MTLGLDRRFAVDGVELAWDTWGAGDGPPLVLCHGYTGSAVDFGLQIPELAAGRRVYALDHRGHGLSTNVADEAAYSFDRLAADLAAWLTDVVGEPVHLLGHSMGGRLVQKVTLDHPDLVASLILMDTSAGSFSDDDAMIELMHGFLDSFDPARGLPSFVSEGEGPEQELLEGSVDAAFLAGRAERSALCDPYAFRALGRQLVGAEVESLLPRLGELTVPTTVIVGSEDHPLVEFAPAIVEAIRDAELVVIDGAYHSPQLTHPDAWRRAVEAHLASVS